MTISPYFNHRDNVVEQTLINDLTVETIQQRGLDILYIPRSYVGDDALFGEASNAFTEGVVIEMLLDNVDGYSGDGEFGRFLGLEIQDNCNFVCSKTRFTETVTVKYPDIVRPMEGDLIALVPGTFQVGSDYSMTVFEIIFTEDENPTFTEQNQPAFFQLGSGYTYTLRCQLFRYSYEKMESGDDDADSMGNLETNPQISDIQQIQDEGDLIIDFSEPNPFQEKIIPPTTP